MVKLLIFSCIVLFIMVNNNSVHSFSFAPHKIVVHNNHILKKLSLQSGSDDNYDKMKLDESKLSKEEKERIAFIQKLTSEADQMIKDAGIRIDNEDDEIDKAVIDTQWTGQSDMEVTRKSQSNYNDLFARPVLAIGDLSSLILFASIGRSNHGEDIDLISVILTSLPFISSWFIISPLLGAYTRTATSSQKSVATEIILSWSISIPVALLIRGLVKGDVPPTPFIIVSLLSTYTLLFLWRTIYIYAFGETSDSEFRKAGFLEVFKMVGTLVKRW